MPDDDVATLFTGALKQLRLTLARAEMAVPNGNGRHLNMLLHFRQAVAVFQHEYDRRDGLHDEFVDDDDAETDTDDLDSLDSTSMGSWDDDAEDDEEVDELNDACPVGAIRRAGSGPGTGVCSVCLLEYAPHHIVWHLPCSHVFHHICLKQWWRHQTARTCPICKTEYHAK